MTDNDIKQAIVLICKANSLVDPIMENTKEMLDDAAKRLNSCLCYRERESEKENDCTTDVHTRHCCKNCGCKYGDKDCPVVTGTKVQEFPCGDQGICGGW